MGGLCSKGTVRQKLGYREKNFDLSRKLESKKSFSKTKQDNYTHSSVNFEAKTLHTYELEDNKLSISQELRPSTPARTPQPKTPQASFLGRAGIAGLEKAVEVLDTIGSGVSNLNSSSGFISSMGSKGNKISILAFEIANTIAKGANIMDSLSKENVQILKSEVLQSEGVRLLVSTDMKELLTLAAADKREEFDVLCREVIRFGDLCKDPQWHHLGRYFSRLENDHATHKQQRADSLKTLEELTTLAQNTSELYHELNALDRFEQDFRQKLEELKALHLPQKGEGVMILQSELKHQRKVVKSLRRKSLWAKSLEEVVEKLVDLVTFIHLEIFEVFSDSGLIMSGKETLKKPERLGVAGLALHYANVINQIDNISSRPMSLPPNVRDQLYQGLPDVVKVALRSRCQATDATEELTVPKIKAEMEKTLQWLVPVATNTTKAHQGFGWVGEWANSGNEFGKKGAFNNSVIRLQTLYHADKQKTDRYILELVTWLHRLLTVARQRDHRVRVLPVHSPTCKGLDRISSKSDSRETKTALLSEEDQNLLARAMSRRRLNPGLSKSQEFTPVKMRGRRVLAVSRSTGSSPRRSELPVSNCLDVIDGIDPLF